MERPNKERMLMAMGVFFTFITVSFAITYYTIGEDFIKKSNENIVLKQKIEELKKQGEKK